MAVSQAYWQRFGGRLGRIADFILGAVLILISLGMLTSGFGFSFIV